MERAWKRLVWFSTLGVLQGVAGQARASDGPPIHLLLRGCADVREAEVERVIWAELRTGGTQSDDTPDPTWVVATCENQRVLIEVTDAVSRKTLTRSFLLTGAAPEARSRLVGIAAAELVLASWAELALRPVLRVEPEGPRPSAARTSAAVQRARTSPAATPTAAAASTAAAPPTAAEARPGSDEEAGSDSDEVNEERDERRRRKASVFDLQPESQRRFRVVMTGSSRFFTDDPGVLWGGGVRVGQEPFVNTSWALDSLFESGTVRTSNGDVEINTWTVGALLYVYGRLGFVTARAGAGLRAGLATTRKGDESSSVVLPWGWPMAALSLSFGKKAMLDVSGEAGYASLPLAPTSTGLSIQGVWVAVQVGVGIVPSAY